MATDTSLEDGTNIMKHICIEYENVREFSEQLLHVTETNSNEFKDTCKPSDTVSYLNLKEIYLLTNKM
jgi:hypothetical protein